MKKVISFFLIVIVILTFNLYSNNKVQPKSIAQVLENAWDEFGLFSFQIGKTDPIISITMDETKSEEKLLRYLEDNIDKSVLNEYEFEFFKKNVQVAEYEHKISMLDHKIYTFLKEEHHINVNIQTTKTNQPIVHIILPTNAVKSASQVQNDVLEYLSKNSDDESIKDLNLTVEVTS